MKTSEIRAMMSKETMMTGRKAAELKFADVLLEKDADADVAVSADHHSLFAFGRKMRLNASVQLPAGIKVVDTLQNTSVLQKSMPTSGNHASMKNHDDKDARFQAGLVMATWRSCLKKDQKSQHPYKKSLDARRKALDDFRKRCDEIDELIEDRKQGFVAEISEVEAEVEDLKAQWSSAVSSKDNTKAAEGIESDRQESETGLIDDWD